MRTTARSAFLLVVCGFVGLVAAEPATELPLPHLQAEVAEHGLAPDPAIRYGRLENGLGYGLMHHAQPPGKVSLRLLVLVGSRHERDDERGMAHYLEHMAFNGSENFPPGTVIETLQEMGAAFGSHTNAHTSFDETVYKLDLPDTEPATLATGLQILADWARRLDLAEEEVDDERGVILAELRDRESAGSRAWTELLPVLLKGRAAAHRMPIGTAEAIESFDAAGMRAFYDRWYRPERMFLSVVGDVDLDAVEAALTAEFGGLAGVGPAPEWSPGELEPADDLQVQVHRDPEFGGSTLMYMTARPLVALPDGPERRRRSLQWGLGAAILARRFAAIAEDPAETRILGGRAEVSEWLGIEGGSVVVQPRPGQWQAAVPLLEQELRRFAEHGPTAEELETARSAVRAQLERAVESADARRNPSLAASIYSNVKDGQVALSPSQARDFYVPLLEAVTPEEIRAAYAAAFSEARRQLLIMLSGEDLGTADVEHGLREAWQAAAAETVKAPEEATAVAWAYGDLPPPAEPTLREELAHGIERVVYPNQISAAVLSRDEEPGQVLITASLHVSLAPQPCGWRDWLAGVGQSAGLGEHPVEELRRLMAGNSIVLNGPDFTGDRAVFTVSCRPGEIELALQWLRAALVDAGWRPEVFERSRTAWLEGLAGAERDLDAQVGRRWGLWVSGGHPQLRPTSADEVRALELAPVRAWFDPLLKRAPLEVAVVGDVAAEDAIAAIAATLGTLPEREAIPVISDLAAPGAMYPLAPLASADIRFAMEGGVDRAVVRMAWPTVDLGDIHTVRRLGLLAEVVSELLRREVREELGEAYSPGAGHSASQSFDGHGLLSVGVGVAPGREDAVIAVIDELIADLRRDGIPEDVFTQVKEPAVSGLDAYRRQNSYWLGQVVSQAVSRPQRLEWADHMVEDYRAITREELEALAETYLVPEQLVQLVGVSRKAEATEAPAEPAADDEGAEASDAAEQAATESADEAEDAPAAEEETGEPVVP